MKILVQRVKKASVTTDNIVKGKIQRGYLLYVCFEMQDTMLEVEQGISKIKSLRIFEDENEKMNLSIVDVKGEILSISQFTLSWDGKKGHRPSFAKSLTPNQAKILYRNFNDGLEKEGIKIQKGTFGADMKVSSINDGPVTFFLEF